MQTLENSMYPDKATYEKIEAFIHCDSSPVGIDAKKTHIQIIYMLQQLLERVEALEHRLDEKTAANQ